ncbi:MAG: AMMECR1 domain-containing protein [Candidatus Gracilibacteria bacterium]|nr:AMMECR1 domain-containing protein [Candidatus Gracilibacteria bacterium]
MISIAKQTIEYFTKYQKAPRVDELKIDNPSLLESNGSIFITIYQNGQVRGSSGNIKEIKTNLVEEIIENTVGAISKDTRFKPLKYTEINDIKIRIDKIVNRKILQDKEIFKIDPTKSGILVIKKDYTAMAAILPNINQILLNGEDLIPILESKFNTKKFEEKDYILYEIKTEVTDNFETTKNTV